MPYFFIWETQGGWSRHNRFTPLIVTILKCTTLHIFHDLRISPWFEMIYLICDKFRNIIVPVATNFLFCSCRVVPVQRWLPTKLINVRSETESMQVVVGDVREIMCRNIQKCYFIVSATNTTLHLDMIIPELLSLILALPVVLSQSKTYKNIHWF